MKSILEALVKIKHPLILTHNDPDPDAVASAVALRYLVHKKMGIDSPIAYEGIIGRAENKALAQYLGNPLQHLSQLEPKQYTKVILIDTQPGAGNNTLPAHATLIAVVDHHPLQPTTGQARYADVRPDIGSTSTILTEYIQAAGLEPDPQLATALFYGIKTDTMGLTRQTTTADASAYFYLQPRMDSNALLEIERAQVPIDYFKIFDSTLRAAQIYHDVVIAFLGTMVYPDMVAEMADVLLRLEGSKWIICMGVFNSSLILSVRTRNPQGGAGRLAQAVVGNEGPAGGHGTMAGGQILLAGRNPKLIVARIKQRALKHLDLPPNMKGQRLV